MDATHYCPFAREYSILECSSHGTTIWMADPEPQTLSNAIEQVYTAFFCNNSTQQLRTISEEVLFGHFVTTLNDAFERQLALNVTCNLTDCRKFILICPNLCGIFM